MSKLVGLDSFLHSPGIIFDVRSPAEFFQGHIPGAESLPLFSDEERAIVGTLYKKAGRLPAVEAGLEIVGPKLILLLKRAKEKANSSFARVHCWRGGMRSSSVAWLLEMGGFQTTILEGGYKSFRRSVLPTLSIPRQIIIVGGLTGSGKTAVLHALQKIGEQVLDLEGLAGHRGSSYGMLSNTTQPTCEQFENEIAARWASFDPHLPVWIEDESRMIGRCQIPDAIFQFMRQAPLFMIKRPRSERLQRLGNDYFNSGSKELIMATQRIAKKLGGVRVKEVIALIESGRMNEALEIVLNYYDKAYIKTLESRNSSVFSLEENSLSDLDWAYLMKRTLCTKKIPPLFKIF